MSDIDHLLNRSLFLDKLTDFETSVDLKTQYELSSSMFSTADITREQKFLAKETLNGIIGESFDNYRSIGKVNIGYQTILSFDEYIECELRKIIVSSVTPDEDFNKEVNEYISDYLKNIPKNHLNVGRDSGRMVVNVMSDEMRFYSDIFKDIAENKRGVYDLLREISSRLRSNHGNSVLVSCYDLIYCLTVECKNNRDIESYITGVISFLEKKMKDKITSSIYSDIVFLNTDRTRSFGIIATIKEYVRTLRHPYRNSPWAVLYYAIRCGAFSEVLDYAGKECGQKVYMAIKAKSQCQEVPGTIIESLMQELSIIRFDPYRAICLSVLSKFSSAVIDEDIISTLDDWIWLRLNLGHNIEQIKKDASEKRFEDSCEEGYMDLLLCDPEEAVKVLLKNEGMCHSFHLAYCIIESSLAAPSETFVSKLRSYCTSLASVDLLLAFYYPIVLLYPSIKYDIMATLIIENEGGVNLLLPDLRTDVQVEDKYRVIDYFSEDIDRPKERPHLTWLLSDVDIKNIVTKIIENAEKTNNYKTLTLFYRYYNSFDAILEITCVRVSNCFSRSIPENELKEIEDIYNEMSQKSTNHEKLEELLMLLNLAKGFFFYRKNKFSDALKYYEESNLIPSYVTKENVLDRKGLIIQAFERFQTVNRMVNSVISNMCDCYVKVINKLSRDDNNISHFIARYECVKAIACLLDIDVPLNSFY